MTAPEITQVCTSIGTLVGVIVTAFLTLRNGLKSDRNNQTTLDVGHAVAGGVATVNQIQKQTNGGLTAALKATMISAETLAHSTGNPSHRREAEAAREEYNKHLAGTTNQAPANDTTL
jgi:hypothetical protein